MSDSNPQKRNQKIVSHVRALHESAGDEVAYTAALNAVRDDSSLGDVQKGAIYKTLAQQSLLWYIEACTGKPVDLAQVEAKMAQLQTTKG